MIAGIMMPVTPEQSERILDGREWLHVRRTRPVRDGARKLWIYATHPVCRVTGSVSCGLVFRSRINREGTCLTDEEVRSMGKAPWLWELSSPEPLEEPARLERFGLREAPRGFVYLGEVPTLRRSER